MTLSCWITRQRPYIIRPSLRESEDKAMDAAHVNAQETRQANEAARAEAARNRARAIASLQDILGDSTATAAERLEAARLIVELGRAIL